MGIAYWSTLSRRKQNEGRWEWEVTNHPVKNLAHKHFKKLNLTLLEKDRPLQSIPKSAPESKKGEKKMHHFT